MHSLEEILTEIRKNSQLCQAVEKNGIICFNQRRKDYKYCHKHRERLRRHKSFDLPIKKEIKCKFIDCERKARGQGYCHKHWTKYIGIPKNKLKKCVSEDCTKKRCGTSKYCGKHLKRLKVHKNLEGSGKNQFRWTKENRPAGYQRKKLYDKCIVPNCNYTDKHKTKAIVKGLCALHYQRWKKTGSYYLKNDKDRSKNEHSKSTPLIASCG